MLYETFFPSSSCLYFSFPDWLLFRAAGERKKYLLFLTKTDGGRYGILGVFQGKVNIDDTDDNEKTATEADPHFKQLKKEILAKFKPKLEETL